MMKLGSEMLAEVSYACQSYYAEGHYDGPECEESKELDIHGIGAFRFGTNASSMCGVVSPAEQQQTAFGRCSREVTPGRR
jgi:hypothetical protein